MAYKKSKLETYYDSRYGTVLCGDSRDYLSKLKTRSVDLIVTSPPYGLTSKKEYGNEREQKYLEWFETFTTDFKRVLKSSGSLVLDLGGSYKPGSPTRSLYQFKLLIMLCEKYGFHLAQEFYWWNPSKLPAPAQWVTVDRVRVKDSVNTIWWLSAGKNPKADNRKILVPYSSSMNNLLETGAIHQRRPSGHDITENFLKDNGAAIPHNVLAIANTASNDPYLTACREKGLKAHPARFPREIPEFFIRYLTDPGDVVIDPFAGSCVTGEVAERLKRKWTCIEKNSDYLMGALERFEDHELPKSPIVPHYTIHKLGSSWSQENKQIKPKKERILTV